MKIKESNTGRRPSYNHTGTRYQKLKVDKVGTYHQTVDQAKILLLSLFTEESKSWEQIDYGTFNNYFL